MKDSIFRKYDIRGKVGTDLLIEDVYNFGRSLAHYLTEKNNNLQSVAVGMDGRTHSPAIKIELINALLDSGINVTFIGVCPTPLLYFSTYNLDIEGGVMITASHNPKEYNGFKIVLGNESLHDKEIQALKETFKEGKNLKAVRKGKYKEEDLHTPYLNSLEARFPHLKNSNFSAVIDCGNGAAGTVIPALVERMNWKNTKILFEEVDGNCPNHQADPTQEKNMLDVKHHLHHNNTKIGIGFDGDVDRIGVMTKDGYLIPCDKLIAIFSKLIAQNNPSAGIVFDVRCSSALSELLETWGARPLISQCGHAFIKKLMHEEDGLFGGELSGHFCFKDKHEGYDDAIYAMLRLVELLEILNVNIEDLLEEFPHRHSTPEFRLECNEEHKIACVENAKKKIKTKKEYELNFIDGMIVKNKNQWGIIRPSNTQAEISVRMEGATKKDLKTIKLLFIDALSDYFENTYLKDVFGL